MTTEIDVLRKMLEKARDFLDPDKSPGPSTNREMVARINASLAFSKLIAETVKLPVAHECQCERPMIKCDSTGCRCTICGEVERSPVPGALPACMMPDGGHCCETFARLDRVSASLAKLLSESIALNSKLQAEIGRLRMALVRIDAINDNPACFNVEIDEVVDPILHPQITAEVGQVGWVEGEPER